MLGADEKAAELEYQVFCEVRSKVADEAVRVGKVARAVAELDVLAVARRNRRGEGVHASPP